MWLSFILIFMKSYSGTFRKCYNQAQVDVSASSLRLRPWPGLTIWLSILCCSFSSHKLFHKHPLFLSFFLCRNFTSLLENILKCSNKTFFAEEENEFSLNLCTLNKNHVRTELKLWFIPPRCKSVRLTHEYFIDMDFVDLLGQYLPFNSKHW